MQKEDEVSSNQLKTRSSDQGRVRCVLVHAACVRYWPAATGQTRCPVCTRQWQRRASEHWTRRSWSSCTATDDLQILWQPIQTQYII